MIPGPPTQIPLTPIVHVEKTVVPQRSPKWVNPLIGLTFKKPLIRGVRIRPLSCKVSENP